MNDPTKPSKIVIRWSDVGETAADPPTPPRPPGARDTGSRASVPPPVPQTQPLPAGEAGFDAAWLTDSKPARRASKKRKSNTGWIVAAVVGAGACCLGVAGLVIMGSNGSPGNPGGQTAAPSGRSDSAPGKSAGGEKPKPPPAKVIDLGRELQAAGFRPDSFLRLGKAIQHYLRYGDYELAERARRDRGSGRTIEQDASTPDRQERICRTVYGLFNRPIAIPPRSGADNLFWIRAAIPLRLYRSAHAESSSSDCELSVSRVTLMQPWALTKDMTLVLLRSVVEENEIKRRNGILYYPESTNASHVFLKLDRDLDVWRAVAARPKEYRVDLVFEDLSYDELHEWGYYRADALTANWDCDSIVANDEVGLNFQSGPLYFRTSRQVKSVTAELVAVRLKDSSNRVVVTYRNGGDARELIFPDSGISGDAGMGDSGDENGTLPEAMESGKAIPKKSKASGSRPPSQSTRQGK